MKVFCALIAAIAAICFSFPAAYTAEAEGAYVYARAESSNAYFCSDADSTTSLFAIPYSYCVRIISEDGIWYYASYAEDQSPYRAVYGYVLKNSLTILDEQPEVTWLYYTLTVTYTQSSAGGLPTLGDITATAAFYGNYYSGLSGYSYVLCQGSFGYIVGSTEDYEIIETQSSSEETSSEDEESTADGKLIAGIVLGTLAVAALLIIFMSGRRGNRQGSD
ncbi:MAG: hypothetical protein LUI60_02905 [Clostridia bacterium]|nr:hypothetical protein [Clostridia bacterium]